MTINESTLDRALRAVAGVLLAVAAFVVGGGSTLGIVLIVLAAVLLVTAAAGFCPIYRLLGIRTNAEPIRSGARR
jgi:hypothetical protein